MELHFNVAMGDSALSACWGEPHSKRISSHLDPLRGRKRSELQWVRQENRVQIGIWSQGFICERAVLWGTQSDRRSTAPLKKLRDLWNDRERDRRIDWERNGMLAEIENGVSAAVLWKRTHMHAIAQTGRERECVCDRCVLLPIRAICPLLLFFSLKPCLCLALTHHYLETLLLSLDSFLS